MLTALNNGNESNFCVRVVSGSR